MAIEAFAAASVQYDSMIVRGEEIVDPLHHDAQWFGAKQEYGHAESIGLVESMEPGPGWSRC